MSVHSSFVGPAMAGTWPVARILSGVSAVPVGHAIDLAFFFPDKDGVPHDALIAETRRHLAGCVASVEIALRQSVAHSPAFRVAIAAVANPAAWSAISANPTILSPALLDHMRLRAALTLMMRQTGQGDADPSTDERDGPLPAAHDADVGDHVASLALAEARWLAPGGEDQAMRADLPAELYAELVWTIAACLFSALPGGTDDRRTEMLAALERSGWSLLADHDEAISPIALADILVRRMGDRADDPDMMGAALEEQRFLLFAALAGRALRVPTDQVIEALLLGSPSQVATICRALGGSDADFRYLLLAVRPARPFLTDAAVLAEAERYGALSREQADTAIGAMRTPAAFRAKLDHILMAARA